MWHTRQFERPLAVCAVLLALLCAAAPGYAQQPRPAPQKAGLSQIQQYIRTGWSKLTRDPEACSTVVDKRDPRNSTLYFPADMQPPAAASALERRCGVHIRHLPEVVHRAGQLADVKFKQQGLLYLPNAYVVPGGFFNEMYGWDSYFIILGLLRDGRVELARGMVDNFLFEIEHYGAVLNANRTYFLSRSQPPFLTSMILAVHRAQAAAHQDDRAWLARAYADAVRDYHLWNTAPHLAGNTGLSRFFDFGEGPAPEVSDENDNYYEEVARSVAARGELAPLLTIEAAKQTPGSWPRYSVFLCPAGAQPGAKCPAASTVAFTADYYKGDRSDRESGFDITFRFGPFAAWTHHFAAVGLNSLLFKAETDLVELSKLAGHPEDAPAWERRAQARRAAVDKYLWDAQAGMYFDYDFEQQRRSHYVFATTFWPLWAGLASPEQARAVDRNLQLLERPGGLATSTNDSGAQWDLPYGWAPLQLLAVQGLRRYGFDVDANRLSVEFLSTVLDNFGREGTIREKYNVVTSTTETNITTGYRTNVVGFGWTNGVFLELLHELPETARQQIQ